MANAYGLSAILLNRVSLGDRQPVEVFSVSENGPRMRSVLFSGFITAAPEARYD